MGNEASSYIRYSMILNAVIMTFSEKESLVKVLVSFLGGASSFTMESAWRIVGGILSILALSTTIYKNYLEIKRIKEKKL
jgi:hypothetical protein